MASSARGRVHAPAWCLASAAAMARMPRRVRSGVSKRRAFQERGRGGQAAAGLGAGSRPLKLGGDVLIRFAGRRGAVPGEPVGVGDGIGDVR